VSRRRKKLREMARDYKGGSCMICGYKNCQRSLSFHHLNPKEKDFDLSSRGLTRSWERIKKEIDKCVLLCANCHMEVHDGITQLPKET
jgi:5-methylcytosine-specific restriction endonuclease McrA